MNKVSVIIPVYNVEEYLSQCLDSVVNQTYENLQIICIDDGSTDNSLKILNKYAEQDNRITLKSQKNQGVSVARNTGIYAADGNFIAFLDSDDWWEPDLVNNAVSKLLTDGSDIVIFGHNYYKNGKIIPDNIKEEKIDNVLKQGKNYLDYTEEFMTYIWDKVYRTSLIKDNKIKFPLNLHPSEDVLFALECLSYNPVFSFLPEHLYNYRMERNGSAMNNYKGLVTNQIAALKKLLDCDFYREGNTEFKQKCLDKILNCLVYCQLIAMKNKCSSNNFNEIAEALIFIKENISDNLIENNKGYAIMKSFVKIHKKDVYL